MKLFFSFLLVLAVFLVACNPTGERFPEEQIADNGQLYFTFEEEVGKTMSYHFGATRIIFNDLQPTTKAKYCEGDAVERGYDINWCVGEDHTKLLNNLKMRCKCELAE
jgi:hypothetical protein